jgi:aminoglycoside 3-N-acetyltransferase
MYDYDMKDLRTALRALEIGAGTCVFMQSAMKSIGKINPDPFEDQFTAILEVILEVVGETGSLSVPTFNFRFCKGEVFDYDNTPSDGNGAFSEFVRRDRRALRSPHPFHSFATIGNIAKSVAGSYAFSEFSEGSAFDLLLKNNVKTLFFGVDYVETFAHVAEERAKVPYRYWKIFAGTERKGGVDRPISTNFYARRVEDKPEPVVDIPKLGRYCRDLPSFRQVKLGNGFLNLLDGNEMVDALTEKFIAEPTFALVV